MIEGMGDTFSLILTYLDKIDVILLKGSFEARPSGIMSEYLGFIRSHSLIKRKYSVNRTKEII